MQLCLMQTSTLKADGDAWDTEVVQQLMQFCNSSLVSIEL